MTNNLSNDDAIITQGLVRQFGTVRAVDGVDLRVPKGQVFGFLGPNGAARRRLSELLITLLAPTAGELTVAGYDVMEQPTEVRRVIGAALPEAALDNKQTGRELLNLQGRLYGLTGKQLKARIADLSTWSTLGKRWTG